MIYALANPSIIVLNTMIQSVYIQSSFKVYVKWISKLQNDPSSVHLFSEVTSTFMKRLDFFKNNIDLEVQERVCLYFLSIFNLKLYSRPPQFTVY